ncbi:meiotically up-regulated gene 113-domain-containing protein [Thelonectria olida]|uniref:Meiotically up-regulated gene 113-domain-containing protein n=1 Tax=Thelonectria olida TaxID=1576542 RepID=A0A9P8WHV6_9HYPO|nr:meiotically up-regulated gene 113-domain-containing protein [Thelonectria olida]
MAPSTQLLVWPTESSSLRDILGLDPNSQFCCHGTTKKGKHCKIHVSKDNSLLVSSLLIQIVKKRSLDAARSLLSRVSQLVMCQKYHQYQGSSWLSSWEKKLTSFKSPPAKVKKEEDGGDDVKLVLAELEERKTESDQQDQSSPYGQIKVEAETNAPVKEEEPPLVESPPTAISSKPTLKKRPTQHNFERYASPLCTRELNQRIKDIILRPLTQNEKQSAGYIYTYVFPGNYHDPAPYLKIGYTKDVEARMASWQKQCGYEPCVLSRVKADNYVRVERLVHAQLHNKRMRETKCPTCSVKHKEWFDVRSYKSDMVIGLWAAWARQNPYAEDGCLKKEWVKRVEGVDLDDARCWEQLVQ